jgi:hypothetical protein
MSASDTAELLAEIRALRQEVLELKLQMARHDALNLSGEVKDLAKRVQTLELWRAGLAALSSAGAAGAIAALAKIFGV